MEAMGQIDREVAERESSDGELKAPKDGMRQSELSNADMKPIKSNAIAPVSS
jgi:hypothetical protein